MSEFNPSEWNLWDDPQSEPDIDPRTSLVVLERKGLMYAVSGSVAVAWGAVEEDGLPSVLAWRAASSLPEAGFLAGQWVEMVDIVLQQLLFRADQQLVAAPVDCEPVVPPEVAPLPAEEEVAPSPEEVEQTVVPPEAAPLPEGVEGSPSLKEVEQPEAEEQEDKSLLSALRKRVKKGGR